MLRILHIGFSIHSLTETVAAAQAAVPSVLRVVSERYTKGRQRIGKALDIGAIIRVNVGARRQSTWGFGSEKSKGARLLKRSDVCARPVVHNLAGLPGYC
jgi:O-glycosyl hydrolase